MALVWRDYRQGCWSHSLLFTHDGYGLCVAMLCPVTYRDFGPVVSVRWDIDPQVTGIEDEDGEPMEGHEDTRAKAKRKVRKILREYEFTDPGVLERENELKENPTPIE